MICSITKVSLLLCALVACTACAPGQFWDRHSGDLPEFSDANFEYVGCHLVDGGEKYAMAPFGFNVIATGSRIWFKQRNSDESSAALAAKPC